LGKIEVKIKTEKVDGEFHRLLLCCFNGVKVVKIFNRNVFYEFF